MKLQKDKLANRKTSFYNSDAEKLAKELEGRIEGEVRFDEGNRALYATDLSMYRQVPIGIVIPRNTNDVIETVAACRQYGVPILGRGCGTSLAGQGCNVAVIIDFSKYINRIIELDPESKTAWVEPGVINDQLRDAAEQYHPLHRRHLSNGSSKEVRETRVCPT